MTAVALSLLANVAIVLGAGVWVTQSASFIKKTPAIEIPPESVATIFLEPIEVVTPDPEPSDPRFARTTADQAATPDKPTSFIGERNTRATSERPPVTDSPPLPSQAGIQPRDATDIETTESRYQDGALDVADTASPPASPETPPETASTPEPEPPVTEARPAETEPPPPSTAERLLEGPNPVDIQVPRGTLTENNSPRPNPADPKPIEASANPPEPRDNSKTDESKKSVESTKTKPARDPAFKGNQRKTAIVGSISRTGRSSLDVADSPLGRYQAAISRAVELEWQRNCVRHRDFITPGFLTVRFFVEPDGSVRSVEFIGEQLSGAVQKGFTHSSIRDAEIPPMPPALRRDYQDEPLELQFRFYF